ncbi:BRCA1-associated ATM activator 1 isoform X1 [Falco rusticolus]|uniref:BRCA1-associated ATM activator 1 n=1 Tax=Falco cherrug TaxID=345164 RepID=UPI0018868E7E|nr:BRCA1-associated ATM activator 1 isoform X1 [Falco rusticolus]XP_055565877.1 BRCA1-associated ATM activator 1 [Falco cherrug]
MSLQPVMEWSCRCPLAMTRECSRLLPRVCAALADPRQPGSDDTSLEKLLDWFRELKALDPTMQLLQDNPCLTEFITSVLALPEPSPSILSFTLRLAGILASSETCFQHLQQENLLLRLFGRNGPLSSAAWEDASVRSGWVEGVRSMMDHHPALHFLCNGGGIDVIFTLQGDPSLFVASAASQLLVDMLTLSVEPETATPLSTKDCDWPACARMIIKRIEDSLQSSSASHIEQSLKLLTTLFGRCTAPWTVALWLGMAEKIESLLTEETVQAQHMLANLLLNVAWSPLFCDTEGSFWALVTSALERLTPVQVGPLAVGLLKLYKCPQDVKIQALTVLLQPMDCILRAASQPLEYAGLLDESVSDPIAVESLLSSKSTCATVLCQTLAHLEELLSLICLPVDLPCTSLLRSLMTILQFCNGFLRPASPLGSTISRILINCFRVQRSALDVLAALSEQRSCDMLIENLFDVLLAYLESPNTSPTVLKKTFQATSKWLVRLQELSCSNSQQQQTEKILEDVFLVLQKRLCSPCWEVRDSSLEFLTVLIKHLRDQDEFRQSLLSSEVPRLTESLLEDPESYVRASAVTAVGHLAFITYFAPESPAEGNQYNKENTVAKLQEILSTDPEGFPRRAVISIFTKWLRQGCTGQLEDTEQFVSRVVQTVEHDLDWEVRLGGLELVQVFCTQTICQLSLPKCPYAPVSSAVTSSIHQNESLQIFCRAKLFSFLFRSLCDCDKPVGQRACNILLGLSNSFYPISTLQDSQGTEESPVEHGIAWLERTLKQGSLAQNFPTDGGNGVDFQDPESMMLALGTIDFIELCYELSKSSDYVEKSPESLLQDILATAGAVEENEADCY